MFAPEFVPLSLPLGMPHPKSEYYLMVQVDSAMYDWVLVRTESGTICEKWKNIALTRKEVERNSALIMDVLSPQTKRLLFQDETAVDSSVERRQHERIPVVYVYCFCEIQAQREILSLLFRPCQVALLDVATTTFPAKKKKRKNASLPITAAAGLSHVRAMESSSWDEAMLLLALGDRVDAILVSGKDYTHVDTLLLAQPRTNKNSQQSPSRILSMATGKVYDFVEQCIQKWCKGHVETEKQLEIIVGGSETSTVLDLLKPKGKSIRVLEYNNAVHVKLHRDDEMSYVVPLKVMETIVFEGLKHQLLSAEPNDAHVVIGCGVRKSFPNGFFHGYVATIRGPSHDQEGLLFGIIYEDGDTEECYTEDLLLMLQQFAEHAYTNRDVGWQRKGKQSQVAIEYLTKAIDSAQAQETLDALWDKPFPVRVKRTKIGSKIKA